ncbi:MAG: MBL fold metallo-hydrolase [Nitrospirae bacterium]|nr:MBL fold metallo-hydrolase [Nitrospirota bacterium]
MKSSFHTRLINGPFEDPGIYVRLYREGRALLFDPGFTINLSARDIFKITDIFVSHAHIDHFIGFDNILRHHLKSERPLNLYGPGGFMDKVEGKLRGYTWNLIEEYPLSLNVFEVLEDRIEAACFRSQNRFLREGLGSKPFEGVVMRGPFFNVSAVILDHIIPCLAYSIKEDFHINIDRAKLDRHGIPVGPWLNKLKDAIRNNDKEALFKVEGKELSFDEAREFVIITEGQKISYVVDALGSDENIQKIIKLAKGSDMLFIETYFLDEDKDRAKKSCHLTAREAGRIAREAGAGRFVPLHFSPKYTDRPEDVIREAEKEFRRG